MRDVTALVLTIGERFADRALASVERQTEPVLETIVMRDVSPFYRALNAGAARVRTTFFIQVDADMILDPTCVADLRGVMAERVGILVGHLRDPLTGRRVGIKLFRTECFEHAALCDAISADTDFADAIDRQGWHTVYALKHGAGPVSGWHTFGVHQPDYNPHYTFCKFIIEGARYRRRKAGGGMRHLFQLLRDTGHPAALYALVATAHGVFLDDQHDLLRPYPPNVEFDFFHGFVNGVTVQWNSATAGVLPEIFAADDRTTFKQSYAFGVRVRQQGARDAFVRCLPALLQQSGVAPWVAAIGVCHGLFAERYEATQVERAFDILSDLLPPRRLPGAGR